MVDGGGPPVSYCGAQQKRRLTKQTCFLLTAATCSGRCIRRRRRSHRSPSRTQKLSTCTPTILGGRRSCCGAQQKRRLTKQTCFLLTAATRSPRCIRHWRRSVRSPGKIGNANTEKASTKRWRHFLSYCVVCLWRMPLQGTRWFAMTTVD